MERTYVFDNGGGGCGENGLMSLIGNLCNKQNLDPALIMSMMNNRGNGFGGDGAFGWFWIVILMIFGWGGFGGGFGNFGGRGNAQGFADLGNLVNNDAGRELLMNAIQGNANAIGQLSTKLGCDYNALSGAIQNLSTQMCNLGNTLGLGQRDIIQAMQNGDQNILSSLASCCCDIRSQIADFKGDLALQMCQQTGQLTNAINFVNSSVERGFASEAYERQAQTCRLENVINAQTTLINDKFCQLEMREMQNKIDALRTENQNLKFAESQQAQNNYLISQLQPVARPAYLTCSPYQAQMHPFGFYGYNGGNCGCNNGCGNNCGGCGCN